MLIQAERRRKIGITSGVDKGRLTIVYLCVDEASI